MKKPATSFLKIVVLLIAAVVLAAMLWFPQIEGQNANADWVTIYFRDPVLAFAYVASIPFFVALYQAYTLLGLIEQGEVFSEHSVKAVTVIKRCALTLLAFVLIGVGYIFFGVKDDDRAGPVALGIYIAFATIVIAAASAIFQHLLKKAAELQSENDLTV